MDVILTYALAVYFVYHLVAKSDLLSCPRAWLVARLPGWMTYPLGCPYCFTAWATIGLLLLSWGLNGVLSVRLDLLLCAPVINYLIGLVADRLSHPMLVVNGTQVEPPVLRSQPWEIPNLLCTMHGDRPGPDYVLVNRDSSRYGTSGVVWWAKKTDLPWWVEGKSRDLSMYTSAELAADPRFHS